MAKDIPKGIPLWRVWMSQRPDDNNRLAAGFVAGGEADIDLVGDGIDRVSPD